LGAKWELRCACAQAKEREAQRRGERERGDGNGESGDMGWRMEVAAGLGFFAVGLIQAFKHMKKMRARKSGFVSHRNRQKSRFHDLDLYTILALCIVHMLFDMAVIHHEEGKSHGFAAAVNVEQLGVVSLFLLYSVVALIVENHRVLLPVPSEVVKLLAMFAFGQEFLLFYFQVDNAGLEVQYYHLLLLPIGVCLVTTGAEIPYPNSDLLPLLRSMALVLQGTWFFQIAASLFTKWISQGCLLSETGEGDYTVSCQGEDNAAGNRFFHSSHPCKIRNSNRVIEK
jgi:hypothetical protein